MTDVAGVTVTGQGSASAVPDVFVVDVASEASAADPGAAFHGASSGLEAIIAAARAAGIAPEDLRSGEMSLWNDHDREGRPHGFRASLRLEVRVRPIDRAGEVLAALVAAGGDAARVQGTRFEHSDVEGLTSLARDAAFADALARAQRYAGLAGRPLGLLEAVVEGGAPGAPRPMATRMALAEAAGPPVEAGALTVSASVTVHWAWA
ncbi:MAG TPA: SIMPL domain-containing protein [Candidatus Limnocylindria bacterium]|nr:SIMPL domain-containing protein [Candidatus Limnocylindria bacterium]